MRGYGPLYYLTEAYLGLRANRVVNLLAVGTVCLAMLLVGCALLLYLNLHSVVADMGARLEITVYLKDGLTDQERGLVKARLRSERGVRTVAFVPKSEALALLKKDMKEQEALFSNLTENPLPDSFEVTIDPLVAGKGGLAALAGRVGRYHGVEDVTQVGAGAEMLSRLLRLVSWGGTAIAALLGIAVVFIISNSVRLALYSRGQEIELMQWIGATRWFITGPFALEGMLVTMLGTSLAIGLLAALFHGLPPEMLQLLAGPGGFAFLPPSVIALMLGGSALLGLGGALISVNKFLE